GFTVDTARKRIFAGRSDRPPFKAAQPLQHILRPGNRFAELAVTDHIDAGFGLFVYDLRDRIRQTLLVGGLIVRFAGLFRPQKLLQRRRANEAANVGGENTAAATLHLSSLCIVKSGWRLRLAS